MKKTLARTPKTRLGFKPLSVRARLGSSLALLALVAGLGLAASRPAHTAGGPIAVNVANTPLATTPTTEPAFQPFQIYLNPSSTTSQVAIASFTVPAGKRLVIETVSSAYGSEAVHGDGYVNLVTTAGGITAPHYLADTRFAQNRQNLTVRYYADPGSTVTAYAIDIKPAANPVIAAAADLELSGYYVNVP